MIKRKQSIIFVVLMLGLLTMVGVIGVVKTGEKKTPLPLEENAVDLPEASLPEGSGQKQNETSAQGSIAVPGTEIGNLGDFGERFLDNQRIEGSISEMLDEAIRFVKKNMKNKTIINPQTGEREDRTDYPITAVREAIINALVHRDYSIHTEGMPIQIIMYEDRMEIRNPGGIYGRIKVDQLGKMQPDTRNPVLALTLEILRVTENRYSGIPTIRREMEKYNLKEPKFADERGSFTVTFYKTGNISKEEPEETSNLLAFCKTPRTRQEICEYLGLSSVTYAIQTHVMPLVESGKIKMSNPNKPKSTKQLFYSV